MPKTAPGIIDLQVNGYAGVDFNDADITLEGYVHAMQALRRDRVTTVLPTLITNDAGFITEQLRRLESYRQACGEKFGAAASGVELAAAAMYHLEGPFISPLDGYRGAHPREFVRRPEPEALGHMLAEWSVAANGRLVIMTFSPHEDTAAEFVRVLRSFHILPAIGHTHANAAQIHALVQSLPENTPILATHLGNACPAVLPRHENPAWGVLAEDACWISMVADGFHLPPEMLKVFWKMRGERAIVVSDATSFAGMTPGNYTAHIGGSVTLTPEGKLHLAGDPGMLAGAAVGAYDAWRHLVSLHFAPADELWRVVSETPAKFLAQKGGFCEVFTPPVEID